MNKLTTKEAIEKAADKKYPTYSNRTKNDTYLEIWMDAANRVFDDMQEEVQSIKHRINSHYGGGFTEEDIQLAHYKKKSEELEAQLTTTRADTLKEVLAWVEKLEANSPDYAEARDEIEAHINQLLNPPHDTTG
jgi:hypothetical protein